MVSKKREKAMVEEVLSLVDGFPSVHNIIDSESPDFILVSNDGDIGLEVVDYIRGQSKTGSVFRMNEVRRSQVVNQAKKHFDKKHKVTFQVTLFWTPKIITRKDVSVLSQALCNLIERCLPEIRKNRDVRIEKQLHETILDNFLYSIHVWTLKSQALWTFADTAKLDVSVDEIQSILDAKEEKKKKYNLHCNYFYLLIVADVQYISSHVFLPNNVLQHCFHSGFDKIIFYDRFVHKLFMLSNVA